MKKHIYSILVKIYKRKKESKTIHKQNYVEGNTKILVQIAQYSNNFTLQCKFYTGFSRIAISFIVAKIYKRKKESKTIYSMI